MPQGFSNRIEHRTGVSLRVAPGVLVSSHLLQLGQLELEQAVEAELVENPALERLDDNIEPLTDETIYRSIAPQELRPSGENYEMVRSMPQGEESVDWLDFAAGGEHLSDHLQAQLLGRLPSELEPVARYVIGCIDDRGYLSSAPEEIAMELGVNLEIVEQVLRAMHECQPLGVGAANLQECLLIQLQHASTLETKLARAIVKEHFEELLERNPRPIMRRYKVMPEVVEAAFREIMSLNPYPGYGFGSSETQCQVSGAGVTPDLVLSQSEVGWTIEVRGVSPQSLSIERSYSENLRRMRESSRGQRDERRHLEEYVSRAKRFISAIQKRHETLYRIGNHLVENQQGFILTGEYRFLKPLTRSKIAKDLGLHESTVSRATMDKFVQIPSGEIVSFEVFFKPALRIQKMIEEILASENPNDPMSDERISALLAERGVQVARRTVNKYRDRTRLLSSRRRRSA